MDKDLSTLIVSITPTKLGFFATMFGGKPSGVTLLYADGHTEYSTYQQLREQAERDAEIAAEAAEKARIDDLILSAAADAASKANMVARKETIEAALLFMPDLKKVARNGMKDAAVELQQVETARKGLDLREELALELTQAARILLTK